MFFMFLLYVLGFFHVFFMYFQWFRTGWFPAAFQSSFGVGTKLHKVFGFHYDKKGNRLSKSLGDERNEISFGVVGMPLAIGNSSRLRGFQGNVGRFANRLPTSFKSNAMPWH